MHNSVTFVHLNLIRIKNSSVTCSHQFTLTHPSLTMIPYELVLTDGRPLPVYDDALLSTYYNKNVVMRLGYMNYLFILKDINNNVVNKTISSDKTSFLYVINYLFLFCL